MRIGETLKVIIKCNRKFALEWILRTENGRRFLSEHQLSILLGAKHYEDELREETFVYSYENGDVYVGRASKGAMKQRLGVLFELVKGRVYVGEFVNGLKQGRGRYETILTKDWCYTGEFN